MTGSFLQCKCKGKMTETKTASICKKCGRKWIK